MQDNQLRTDTEQNEDPIPVFWTGGWDSTFRIVDLVIYYGCRVQPVYVIDRSRRSWRIELDAMQRIREELHLHYPDRSQLLAEIMYFDRAELEAENDVNVHFLQTASEINTSSQYGYLALAAAKSGFPKVELLVHSDDLISTFDFLRERVREVRLGCGATTLELEPWKPTTPLEHAMTVFADIRMPFLLSHPKELEKTASEHGLNLLLESTWTCQVPFRGAPCGVCKTCRYAIRAGKTRHFPKSALLRNRFAPILNPVWIMIVNPKGALRKIAKTLRRS